MNPNQFMLELFTRSNDVELPETPRWFRRFSSGHNNGFISQFDSFLTLGEEGEVADRQLREAFFLDNFMGIEVSYQIEDWQMMISNLPSQAQRLVERLLASGLLHGLKGATKPDEEGALSARRRAKRTYARELESLLRAVPTVELAQRIITEIGFGTTGMVAYINCVWDVFLLLEAMRIPAYVDELMSDVLEVPDLSRLLEIEGAAELARLIRAVPHKAGYFIRIVGSRLKEPGFINHAGELADLIKYAPLWAGVFIRAVGTRLAGPEFIRRVSDLTNLIRWAPSLASRFVEAVGDRLRDDPDFIKNSFDLLSLIEAGVAQRKWVKDAGHVGRLGSFPITFPAKSELRGLLGAVPFSAGQCLDMVGDRLNKTGFIKNARDLAGLINAAPEEAENFISVVGDQLGNPDFIRDAGDLVAIIKAVPEKAELMIGIVGERLDDPKFLSTTDYVQELFEISPSLRPRIVRALSPRLQEDSGKGYYWRRAVFLRAPLVCYQTASVSAGAGGPGLEGSLELYFDSFDTGMELVDVLRQFFEADYCHAVLDRFSSLFYMIQTPSEVGAFLELMQKHAPGFDVRARFIERYVLNSCPGHTPAYYQRMAEVLSKRVACLERESTLERGSPYGPGFWYDGGGVQAAETSPLVAQLQEIIAACESKVEVTLPRIEAAGI